MMLFPFKNNRAQRIVSIIAVIIGILLMISPTTISFLFFNINTFIVGLIFAFFGALYLLDIL